MTLPALDSWLVKGVKLGPKFDYKVGPRCSNPECSRFAEHAHHIVRRSQLAGDYAWVEIDGKTLGNKTGLCVPCHDDITGMVGGHKAAIRWIDGGFIWCLVSTGGHGLGEIAYHPVAPIDPQPPTPDMLAEQPGNPVESDHCPMCGQIKRRRRGSHRPRRRRKTWIVKVPADAEEDGADVLDTLVENLALIIPNADAGMAGRYYVLVHSLAYSTMHSANFAHTLTGEGG